MVVDFRDLRHEGPGVLPSASNGAIVRFLYFQKSRRGFADELQFPWARALLLLHYLREGPKIVRIRDKLSSGI